MISPQTTTTNPAPARQAHFAHRHRVPGWRTAQARIGREAILRLRHTDRQVAVALLFPKLQLITDFLVRNHLISAVDPFSQSVSIFSTERHVIGIQRCELALAAVRNFGHARCQALQRLRSQSPSAATGSPRNLGLHVVLYRLNFCVGVGDKVVDRNNRLERRRTSGCQCGGQGWHSPLDRVNVLAAKVRFRNATVHFHRAHSRNQHHASGARPALRHLMFMNFSAPRSAPKPASVTTIISSLERGCRRNHRVTPMGDVRKRAAVDKGRVVFQASAQGLAASRLSAKQSSRRPP